MINDTKECINKYNKIIESEVCQDCKKKIQLKACGKKLGKNWGFNSGKVGLYLTLMSLMTVCFIAFSFSGTSTGRRLWAVGIETVAP